MKRYENRDHFRERIHIVEVTLQSGEYKGTVKERVRGNTFGLNILNCFDPENIGVDDTFYENNCGLKIIEDDDGNYLYTCTLKNDEGEECEMEYEADRLEDIVVKLEIIDCKIRVD